MGQKEKEARINAEDKRLKRLYKDLPKETMALYEGLVKRAAYMRIQLEDYEQDMLENGYVESFSQSDKLDPYERGRPVVGFYNTMNKNYQSIMKQLKEALPEASAFDPAEDLLKFAIGGKK